MRLAWFSPLPPAETEIGHFTARILPHLSERSEVTLWTDQDRWDPSLEGHGAVRRFARDGVDWAELNRFDACVYNIGNNPLFHGPIWAVSRRHPGLVVLHDFRLQELFACLYHEREAHDPGCSAREEYLTQMEKRYGAAGRRDGRLFWDGGLSVPHMAERYPLTTLALENAAGVLVHTREAFELLGRERRWPVVCAPLPYRAAPRAREAGAEAAGRRGGAPPYRLVIFGYLGPNRRLPEVLQALAALPERERFRLHVYGQLWDPDQVRGRIRSLGLEALVQLHGFVPETELDDALAGAHLAINLRYPSMGEASASQLRIWSHALPSLLTRTGWYASLPADTVAFVRPEHEIADIQAGLRALLADPARFARMGESGRRVLEEQHAPERYAEAITRFAAEVPCLRRRVAASGLAERAGAGMSAWTRPLVSETVLRSVAERVHALLG